MLLIMLSVLPILFCTSNAYAIYVGAEIRYGNCTSGADSGTDYRYNPNMYASTPVPAEFQPLEDDGYYIKQSCVGHEGRGGPIEMDDYKVRLHFDPALSGLYQGAAISAAGRSIAPGFSQFTDMAGVGIAISAAAMDPFNLFIQVEQQKWLHTTLFELDRDGDKACMYAKPLGLFRFTVDKVDLNDRSVQETMAEGETADDYSGGLPENCFYMPEPRVQLTPPVWPAVISPVCTSFCGKVDHDGDPDTPERSMCASQFNKPFLSALVQCVQDTFENMFYLPNGSTGENFLGMIQLRLKETIRGLMALYIIFYGFQWIMGKQKIEMSEATWFILKIALVWYFAVGNGMEVVRPILVQTTQSLSMMVLEASFGASSDIDDADDEVTIAEQNLTAARDALLDSRMMINVAEQGYFDAVREHRDEEHSLARMRLTGETQANIDAQQLVINTAYAAIQPAQAAREASLSASNFSDNMESYDEAREERRVALSLRAQYGYNYCDFRGVWYGDQDGTHLFTDAWPDDPDFTPRVRDMRYMRLWDTVDCKLSRYLGVGDNEYDSNIPQVFLIGVSAVFSHVYGILILILTIVFLLYLFLVISRIVHVYLIAFIGLMFLIMFSPLFIPAVLFNFTNSIFRSWFKQIIAYTLQPFILFCFLTFMFSVYDQIIYEGNHSFYSMSHGDPDSTLIGQREDAELRNKIIMDGDPYDRSTWECPDRDALGCIYQTVEFDRTADIGLGGDFRFSRMDITYKENEVIAFTMIKLIAISYILFQVLALVQEMSTTLVNAAAGGATSVSKAPSVEPFKTTAFAGRATAGAGKLAAGAAGASIGRAATVGARKAVGGIKNKMAERKENKAKEAGNKARAAEGKALAGRLASQAAKDKEFNDNKKTFHDKHQNKDKSSSIKKFEGDGGAGKESETDDESEA